ncbi:MAG: ABC transporter substrate-binding protein [Desulfobulbaceae bacterium]
MDTCLTSYRKMMIHLPPWACCLLALFFLTASGLCLPLRAEDGCKKVIFIRSNYKPDPGSAMVEQFKATLRERGYEEGRNIVYVDILAKPGREAVEMMMKATSRQRTSADLYVTAGWISLPVRVKLSASGTPQLFAPVLMEEAMSMLPSVTEPPGTNLSGVYLSYPPEKILRLARLILPQIQNYAYVFDSQISTDLVLKEAFEELRETERHGMTVHYLDIADGAEQVMRQMQDLRIEAFGGIIGAYKNREALAGSGVPMVTALLMDIDEDEVADRIRDSNILAGLFGPLGDCGELAGEMAADLFHGNTTIDATIPRPARQVAFVNMATADRLSLTIPFTVLEAVDIVVK